MISTLFTVGLLAALYGFAVLLIALAAHGVKALLEGKE